MGRCGSPGVPRGLPQPETAAACGSAVRTADSSMGPPYCRAKQAQALCVHPVGPLVRCLILGTLTSFSLTDSIPNLSWVAPSSLCLACKRSVTT